MLGLKQIRLIDTKVYGYRASLIPIHACGRNSFKERSRTLE